MKERFFDVCREYIDESGLAISTLANLSRVSKDTIKNWKGGRVKRPRYWLEVAKLAKALKLGEKDASRLLKSAGFSSISELLDANYRQDDAKIDEVLSFWKEEVRQSLRKKPFQARHDLLYFVGREEEIDAIKKLLSKRHRVTMYSLVGMGGVGKTALATHIAYSLRSYFSDGILWAQVDKTGTMQILSAFAAEYKKDVSSHTDVESRGQVVRSLLSDKRVLIILDNVQSSDQVEPLLPPSTGSCVVLITTRHPNLSVIRGSHRFDVKPFDSKKGEAIVLFNKLLGEEKTKKYNRELSEIARLLGYLPLAVDIIASRLAYEPNRSIINTLDLLRKEKKRIEELEYEDKSVRASFNLSFKKLKTEEEKKFFAALGVFGGDDFSVDAAAYILSISLEEARKKFLALHRRSLVQWSMSGRYRLHPLLHSYARELLEEVYSTPGSQEPSLKSKSYSRMVSYYTKFISENQQDYNLISEEYSNLLFSLDVARKQQLYDLLVDAVIGLCRYWESQGMYDVAQKWLDIGYDATISLKNAPKEVQMLIYGARFYYHQGKYDRAISTLEDALLKVEGHDRPDLFFEINHALAICFTNIGELQRAEESFDQCINYVQKTNDQKLVCLAYTNYANFLLSRGSEGDSDTAEGCLATALQIARDNGYQEMAAIILSSLATLVYEAEPNQARDYLLEALKIEGNLQNDKDRIDILSNLGAIEIELKEFELAQADLCKALTLCEKVGDKQSESRILRNLGEMYCQTDRYDMAIEHYDKALHIAKSISNQLLILGILNDKGYCLLKNLKHNLMADRLNEAEKCFSKAEIIASNGGFQQELDKATDGLKQIKNLKITPLSSPQVDK